MLFAHPLFLAEVEALSQQVERLKHKDPIGYTKKNAAKRLAAIAKLAFEVIPQNPARKVLSAVPTVLSLPRV